MQKKLEEVKYASIKTARIYQLKPQKIRELKPKTFLKNRFALQYSHKKTKVTIM